MNWLKGNHSISFGGSFSRVIQHNDSQNVVPSIGLGIQSQLDPADGMFNTSNFQGASTGDLNNARALYAFITGRVTAVNAQARLDEDTNKYVYLGIENVRGGAVSRDAACAAVAGPAICGSALSADPAAAAAAATAAPTNIAATNTEADLRTTGWYRQCGLRLSELSVPSVQ